MGKAKLLAAMLLMMGLALPSQAGWLDKAREKLADARDHSDNVESKSTATREFTTDGSAVDQGLDKVDEKNEKVQEELDKADRKLDALDTLFGN